MGPRHRAPVRRDRRGGLDPALHDPDRRPARDARRSGAGRLLRDVPHDLHQRLPPGLPGTGRPRLAHRGDAMASFAGLLGPLVVGVGAANGAGLACRDLVHRRCAPRRRGMARPARRCLGTRARGRPRRTTAGAFQGGSTGRWPGGHPMCFLGAEFCARLLGGRPAPGTLRVRAPRPRAASLATITAACSSAACGALASRSASTPRPCSRDRSCSPSWGSPSHGPSRCGRWCCLGLLLTGVGIGVHWPLGVARVVRASRGMTDRASASLLRGRQHRHRPGAHHPRRPVGHGGLPRPPSCWCRCCCSLPSHCWSCGRLRATSTPC
jgi:hypothetical protein